MTQAKRRVVRIGHSKIYQYFCGNCNQWFTPREPERAEFPEHCKSCNTTLNFENGIQGEAEFIPDDKGWGE